LAFKALCSYIVCSYKKRVSQKANAVFTSRCYRKKTVVGEDCQT